MARTRKPAADVAPLFCNRCGAALTPGRGGYFQVTIEAVADPDAPVVTAEEMEKDLAAEIRRTIARLEGVSPREAMDQVHRRLVIYLCDACYRPWIEDPTP